MFKSHLALGFLAGLFFVGFFGMNMPFLFIILVTLFSGLPDIDHPKSKYGRKLFFISIPISWISKHRGIFHSVYIPILLFFVLGYFGYNYLGMAIVIGYFSHLVGDALTKQGINFLHPFSTFEIRGPITTGAYLETIIFFVIMGLNFFFTAKFLGLL